MDTAPRNEHLTTICERCQYEAAWCVCVEVEGQVTIEDVLEP